jgi:hypothetical protein
MRKVRVSQTGLKLNGTHHLLAYAENVNPLGDNTFIIRKDTEGQTDDRQEVGLEADTDNLSMCCLANRMQGKIVN